MGKQFSMYENVQLHRADGYLIVNKLNKFSKKISKIELFKFPHLNRA